MPTKRENTSPYLVPALERGLKILEMLGDHPGGLLMAEMKELQLPSASLYRMLVTLSEAGYIVRDGFDRYHLGRKLLSLGSKALGQDSLAEKAAVFMRKLRNAVNETTALGVLVNGEGVVIDSVRSQQAVCVYVQTGHHFPLHTAAPAKAIMAFLPEDERDELLDKMVFTCFNERTITGRKEYLAELDKVKSTGIAFDIGEEVSDLRCAAAPVFNSRNHPVAALWVTGPESRLDEQKLMEIGKQIKETASEISRYII